MDPVYCEPSLLGLRQVRIRRYENGFGFTLRHFIVYPPDVCEQIPTGNGETDYRVGKVTEPVDTIFVKSVRENGPAHRAGLSVGDRIVSVNGDRIAGKSYDQVVHLIQNSIQFVHLEVSPKQYDTLQLFYEDKAYRPETNQRPVPPPSQQLNQARPTPQRLIQSQSLDFQYNQNQQHQQDIYSLPQHYYHHHHQPNPPPRRTYPRGLPYSTYATLPHDSPTLTQRLLQRHLAQEREVVMSSSSSADPNQQSFSHLPRPPPYKSSTSTNWSHINTYHHPNVNSHALELQQREQQQRQAQLYYPFQADNSGGGGHLWGIREETKSSESVLGGSSGSSTNSNRYGSMECISNSVQQPMTWKNSPGYRFSISTAPGDASLDGGNRRDISLQGPPGGFVSPSNQTQEMIVTMSGGVNEMPPQGDRGMRGYELKMEDRIRRSMEQKEEFLRRPAQPMQWTPQGVAATVAGGGAAPMMPFPKEFYAQPQKFQKVPWPPENRIVTVANPNQSQVTSKSGGGSVVSDELMTVSMRSHPTPAAKQLGLSRGQMEQLRTTYGGSLDETTSRRLESVSNKLQQQQSFPRSSHHVAGNASGAGRNRVTLVGTGKLHCDPPQGWKHPTISFDETETHVQNNEADVILRKRETDLDGETERLVRRVSYLKATSSPIDMDRKHSSPTTPTKSDSEVEGIGGGKPVVVLAPPPTGRRRSIARFSAEFLPKGRIIRLKQFFEERTQPSSLFFRFGSDSPSSEFRQFGSFPSDKSPDSSEVIREGQVHFKVRAGDAKKGGYYRSWRQGWAQIRRSGCLYLSKERIRKETISGTETDVILCIGLKDGVCIEQAEGTTKRKNVLRLKTCATVETTPVSNQTTNPNQQQSIPVEILIQGEDPGEMIKWIQILQEQQDNNNRTGGSAPGSSALAPILTNSGSSSTAPSAGLRINPNEMSSPRSILRTFLPQQGLISSSNSNSSTVTTQQTNSSNYLTVVTSSAGVQSLATSPKSKTWKGRVAKQWKKIHPTSTNSNSTSSPLHSQLSIPESGATFGVVLENCPQSESSLVPRILEYCVDLVESKGLGMVGIYRIPGNNAAVTALTEGLNKGNEINPEADPRWTDVHVISSLLKSFLRKLPDPLLTSARYGDFIKAAADPDPEKGLEKIRSLVQDLPDPNYETLRHLIFHLRKVADHFERNRMDPRNLAIVFGPTVVRTAEENFVSLVNDMQHQCKIVELLINNVDEIFKEKEDSPTPPEELERNHSHAHQLQQALYDQDEDRPEQQRLSGLANSSPPKIENDIRTSLIQAALRKKQGVLTNTTPPHNTYGLPPHPMERDRSVDESGLIRSYAGLGEETEQRVRQFEMETRAHLYRDARSPGLPPTGGSNYGTTVTPPGSTATKLQPMEAQKLKSEKYRLEAEWRRAKEDLENEDFYDQLADNPSTIAEHTTRGTAYHQPTNQNLSNSSMSSSTHSGGTSNSTALPPYGTWPIRLGPVPFKSQFSIEALPPKPRFNPTVLPFPNVGVRRVGAATPPLRKINSMERLSVESEFEERSNNYSPGTLSTMTTLQMQQKRKTVETSSHSNHYESRLFGSLDSLQNLVNGSKENLSSDGSDLVRSLSKTLEEKMERMRNKEETPPPLLRGERSRIAKMNGKQEGRWGKGLVLGKRRNSLIETRRKGSLTEEKPRNGIEGQISSRTSGEAGEGLNGHHNPESRDVKDHGLTSTKPKFGAANTNSNCKKSKDIQRRHSLGTVDILRFVLGDGNKKSLNRHSDIHISTDTLATTLTTNNIVESHV